MKITFEFMYTAKKYTLLILVLIGLIISAAAKPKKVVADKIAAVVGDRIILQSDITNSIADIQRQGGTIPENAFCMLMEQAKGLPVCVTVTHLDGLVLARSGFHHSINYRSVMAFGHTREITDRAEKIAEMDYFLERVLPERNPSLRPMTVQELKASKVIAMEIAEASAKIRAKPPVDDEEDYALPIWAGVAPITQVMGALEPDPRLLPGVPTPSHLDRLAPGKRLDQLISESTKAMA